MSLFFSQIQETFNNQTKEANFEKVNNHYKDKTFRFDIKDENTNCFLSSDSDKNWEFVEGLGKYDWIIEWAKNDFEKCQGFVIRDIDLEDSFSTLKNFEKTKKIQKDVWKFDWKKIIKNEINNRELLRSLFDKIFLQRLNQKYKKNSQYLKFIDSRYEYKSISKIKKKFKLFGNKINCTNVEQGELGTCYFLETISTLSNYGQLLFQLFRNEKISDEGLYEICLFHEGKWIKVLVDDYFVFKKGTDDFAFSQPINNCLYCCLLEKAYAKIKGSYADINGSNISMASEALTGFKSFMIKTTQLNENIYNYIYNKIKDGYLFSCSTKSHAYSIISIINEENDKIFQIRNPWNELPKEEKELYNEFLKNNSKYIQEKGLKEKEKKETGIFFINKYKFENYFLNLEVCEILFNSSIYYYELDNINYNDNDKIYIYFEIFEDSKLSFDIHNKSKISIKETDTVQVELKDMINQDKFYKFPLKTIRYYENEMSFDIDKYHEIKKSKYLLKMGFAYKKNFYKNKILKIIIEGNVELKYLGCHSEDPIINSNKNLVPEKIEFKKYHYGEVTGKLFKKYKNIIRALEEEFGVEMSPDSRGFYIETILTEEVETIIRYDKEKLMNNICCYDKKDDVYFIGKNHSNGKIEDDNGKALIIVDGEFLTIHTGEIHQNKIEWLLINLDEQIGEAFLKIPKISSFKSSSEIHCIFDKHNLKYKLPKGNWNCNFCSRSFDENVGSFGCRECSLYLCLNCLFNDINYSINIELEFKIEDKKINKIRLFGDDFVLNNKKRKILYNEKEYEINEYLPITYANREKQKIQIKLKEINKINSMKYMFCSCKFTSIKFYYKKPGTDTSVITNMHGMFYNCKELEKINLSQIDTSNVTDMSYMFYNCNKLKEIEGIQKFNTKKVVNMGRMFYNCKELKSLDLSSFDTFNVNNMSFMFYQCRNLKEIKGIIRFNTKQVNDMSFMFSNCEELKDLDLSKFNISKVINMNNIFVKCNTKSIKGVEKFLKKIRLNNNNK